MRKPRLQPFKAQWPLGGNTEPSILIYNDDRSAEYLMPATPEAHEKMFMGKFVRIFFLGYIKNGEMVIEKFIRRNQWL